MIRSSRTASAGTSANNRLSTGRAYVSVLTLSNDREAELSPRLPAGSRFSKVAHIVAKASTPIHGLPGVPSAMSFILCRPLWLKWHSARTCRVTVDGLSTSLERIPSGVRAYGKLDARWAR